MPAGDVAIARPAGVHRAIESDFPHGSTTTAA